MTSRICIVLAGILTCCYAAINWQNPCITEADACHECASTYELSGPYIAKPVGCYKRGFLEYALLIGVSNYRHNTNWWQWGSDGRAERLIADYCGKEALQNNLKYFGVHSYGECSYGYDESNIDPENQGLVPMKDCLSLCAFDVGSPFAMMIYEVIDTTARSLEA